MCLFRFYSEKRTRRKASNVVVKSSDGSTEYVAGDDFNVDAERGRLQIIEGGAIAAGDVQVDYETAACTWTGIRSGAAGELRGSLRVVSDNATGENRDFYFPLVSLALTGELPVIAEGTDFASMQFDVDILKPAGGEAIYVDGVRCLNPFAAGRRAALLFTAKKAQHGRLARCVIA